MDQTLLVWTPNAPLAVGRKYTVTVKGGAASIKDTFGKAKSGDDVFALVGTAAALASSPKQEGITSARAKGDMSMRLRNLAAVTALGLVALLFAPTAIAQTTTGAIQGTVTDEATGVPMLLVTVVATSPKLQGQASEFTDASGQYFLSNLPPGTYSVLFI